ncbi:TetR/AcrR family transcriptional regulator [Dactylosporangium sp. NPDC048998]|uniref:TetR/AcrR family transcriptional regulator n=1 Tax=Dactylosporangium sp. NPDC048998 TaxID=3363976 RepID=UPI003717939E
MPRAGLSPTAVVDAALRVVDAGGPAALTLAAVAAECGVATPSLYKHVAGLAELRGRLAARILDEFTATATAAVLGRSGDDALEALMHAYHAYATQHPDRYALVPQRPDPDPLVSAAAGRFIAVVFAVFKGYDLADDQVVHATRVLRAAMHGFAVLQTEGSFQMAQDVAETHRVLVETMKAVRTAAADA